MPQRIARRPCRNHGRLLHSRRARRILHRSRLWHTRSGCLRGNRQEAAHRRPRRRNRRSLCKRHLGHNRSRILRNCQLSGRRSRQAHQPRRARTLLWRQRRASRLAGCRHTDHPRLDGGMHDSSLLLHQVCARND